MRKLAPAAFLISGILVFGGLFTTSPAYADDEDDESSTSEVVSTPKPHAPHVEKPEKLEKPEKQESPRVKPSKQPHVKRNELEQKYGKEGRLSLPPLVIRPKRDTDEVSSSAFEDEAEDDEDDDLINAPAVTSTKIDKTGTASAGSASAGSATSGSSGSDSGVGAASAGFIAINPAAKNSLVTSKPGTLVDPKQNVPIDISNVQFTRKTPADMFIQAAQVGLYAMGAGAVALALIAASRSIRRK